MMSTHLLHRPYKSLVLAISPLLENDRYLEMTEAEFVGLAMSNCGGSLNVNALIDAYRELQDEAKDRS